MAVAQSRKNSEKQAQSAAAELRQSIRREGGKKPAPMRAKMDEPLIMLTLLLLAVGLVALFSASYSTAYYELDGNSTFYIQRQGTFAAAGVVAMFIISRFNYQKFHYFAIPFLLGVMGLMATVKLIPSLWVRRGVAIRWIELPVIGQFQPSELAKFAIILSFASLITIFGEKKMRTFRWGLLPFGIILAIFAFELYLQRHLSAIMIIAAVGLTMLFIGGIRLYWLIGGGALVAGGGLIYIFSNSYAMQRIHVWLDPWIDPADGGYQAIQSLLAIGSGGFWGMGLGQGRQKQLYLPEPTNDFIFAAWAEEMGFVGVFFVVLIFAAFIWRGYYIAMYAGDKFGTLLAAGITTQFAAQIILNLCVISGLLPVTGASLPFFSYGGTALLIQLGQVGILLAISRRMPVRREG